MGVRRRVESEGKKIIKIQHCNSEKKTSAKGIIAFSPTQSQIKPQNLRNLLCETMHDNNQIVIKRNNNKSPLTDTSLKKVKQGSTMAEEATTKRSESETGNGFTLELKGSKESLSPLIKKAGSVPGKFFGMVGPK